MPLPSGIIVFLNLILSNASLNTIRLEGIIAVSLGLPLLAAANFEQQIALTSF